MKVSIDIGKIKLKDIHKYLMKEGWSLVPFTEHKEKIKKIVDGDNLEYVIPNKEELLDYDRRIEELIEFLAEVEGVEIPEVIHKITKIMIGVIPE